MSAFLLKISEMYATASMKVTGNSHRKQNFPLGGEVVAKQLVAANNKSNNLAEDNYTRAGLFKSQLTLGKDYT